MYSYISNFYKWQVYLFCVPDQLDFFYFVFNLFILTSYYSFRGFRNRDFTVYVLFLLKKVQESKLIVLLIPLCCLIVSPSLSLFSISIELHTCMMYLQFHKTVMSENKN